MMYIISLVLKTDWTGLPRVQSRIDNQRENVHVNE